MVSELPEHRFPHPSSIKEKEVSLLKNVSRLKIAQERIALQGAIDGATLQQILEKSTFVTCVKCCL